MVPLATETWKKVSFLPRYQSWSRSLGSVFEMFLVRLVFGLEKCWGGFRGGLLQLSFYIFYMVYVIVDFFRLNRTIRYLMILAYTR